MSESKDLAISGIGGDALPAGLEDQLDQYKDLGYSEKSSDSIVPLLAVLQDTSGEVKKKHERYIEGAEPGFLIIRSLGILINPEETPVYVQNAAFDHRWVEWEGEPGDGNPINDYPFEEMPVEAVEKKDEDGKTYFEMPVGTRLVDTRYHYVNIFINGTWMSITIPMSGTNHTVSRTWTSQMRNLKAPNGQRVPSWWRAYRVNTKFNSRGSQSWYNYTFEDQGWITDSQLRDLGHELNEAFLNDKIRAEVVSEAQSPATEENDDDMPI